MTKTLLIDGDIILFKFGFRHQQTTCWPGCEPHTEINETKAKRDIDTFLNTLRMQTHCRDFKFMFTSKKNFRYLELPTYKHNRVNSQPPILIKILKDHIRATFPFETREWLEADDLMGIYGTREPDKYVLATIDKDFLSLPATIFLWNKMKEPVLIDQTEADFNFHMQWLHGDTTDGYHGLKGVGPAKAKKMLVGCECTEEMTEVCLTEYAQHCWSYKDCLAQARMARILRHTDYDQSTKKVILWTP